MYNLIDNKKKIEEIRQKIVAVLKEDGAIPQDAE